MNRYQKMAEDFLMNRRQLRGSNDRLITESEIKNLVFMLGNEEGEEMPFESYLSMALRSLRRNTNLYELIHEMGSLGVYEITIGNNFRAYMDDVKTKSRTETQIRSSYLTRLRRQVDRLNTQMHGAYFVLEITKFEGQRVIDLDSTILMLKIAK